MKQAARALCMLLCAIAATSCLIDEDCDAHQVKTEGFTAACVCKPGYVVGPDGYGCVACGRNEEAKDGECVCKDGFMRATAEADCKAVVMGGLGSECEAADECAEEAPFCADSEDAPYCTTQGCERSADCEDGWRCASGADEPFCQKAPAGLGMTCTTSADCTDPEAAFCESFMSKTCMIDDCVDDPNKCLAGTSCCDLTALIGTSLCAPTALLSGGKCPGGADPVEP